MQTKPQATVRDIIIIIITSSPQTDQRKCLRRQMQYPSAGGPVSGDLWKLKELRKDTGYILFIVYFPVFVSLYLSTSW